MLSLEILIGFFIYKSVQNDVQNKINSETRKCVCKEEFRHLISDKENWRQLYDFVVYIKSRRRRAVAPFKKRVGSPGPPGPPGPTGPGGPPGASGTPGPPGPPGLGLEGPIGPPGLQGPSGLPGSEGSVGRPGNGGPIGVPGVAGKDGIPGQNGENGHPGRDGIPGEKGAKGEQGVSGLPGLLGPMGVEGTKGDKGGVGWMGAKGERGETGEPGVVGKSGEKGVCGSTGPPGERGPKGTPGPEGPPGSSSKCSFCEEEPDHIGIENRLTEYTIRFARTDCVSLAIGRKEYFGLADGSYTTFMIDSSPPKESNFGRFWATTHDNTQLLEFQDAIMLTFNNPSRIYNLEIPFDGNSLVVHDGFLFYKMSGQIPKIIRYDLGNHMTISLLIPGFEKCKMKPLYLSGTNYIDLSIDQNGLWAIFTRADSDSTIVMKIDHNDMTIVYTWEVSLNNKHVIDMFIAAGTLYTLQFSPTFEIEINLTINLLSMNVTKFHIKGIEQTGGITAVSYDYKNEQLLIVDGRKRIIYPFYCDDQGLLTTYVRSE